MSDMTKIICHQFTYHDDNYGFLWHDPKTGQTAAIDAGSSDAYLSALNQTGFELTHIFITHHHWDHTDGLAALKARTGARAYGPHNTKDKICDLLDIRLTEGDRVAFGSSHFDVIATPGHTLDMLNYYDAHTQALFSGDSLFVLGCGRLFEGDGPMMWESLSKLLALPDETVVYSAHEYALSNAAFAMSIDPTNPDLLQRVSEIKTARDNDLPTVPSRLGVERLTNPFCRPDCTRIRDNLGMADASDSDVFSQIRARKDVF